MAGIVACEATTRTTMTWRSGPHPACIAQIPDAIAQQVAATEAVILRENDANKKTAH
jgi:hypothetical protein